MCKIVVVLIFIIDVFYSMFLKFLFLFIFMSMNSASIYSIGDTVSVEHRDTPFEVHYGDYPSDTLRLSDHQGKIIIFGLSTSW